MAQIFCITHNQSFLQLLKNKLEDFGIPVYGAIDYEISGDWNQDIVVVDCRIFLSTPKNIEFWGPVFVFSEKPSIKQAVDCIKSGANEYFDVSSDASEIVSAIRDEMSLSNKERISSHNIDEIVGTSGLVLSLKENLSRVCLERNPVLLVGEIGTGKSLAAKTIHANGKTSGEPFLSIDCSSTPHELLETELFGRIAQNQPGLLHINDGRTIYLKEIWAMSKSTQTLFKNYLNLDPQPAAPRIIVGSSNSVEILADPATFDRDLYEKLRQSRISIASLRERADDSIQIANWLLKKSQRRLQKTGLTLSKEAEVAIRRYEWPGNVNELRNALDRATILTKSNSSIFPEQLAIGDIDHAAKKGAKPDDEAAASLEGYFLSFVIENQDSMTETQLAGKLGISRKSLWERRQRLNIPRTKTRKRGPRIEKDVLK